MVTEKFATRTNKIFITGVAYSDAISGDLFYTIGEGLGGLTVAAIRSTGERFETQTGPSGGYALEVSPGTYSLTFSGGPLTSPVSYRNVVINGNNVKVDLITSQVVRLSLSFDKTSINENGESLIATVSRPGATTSALQVDIISNQRSEADFPSSITIPAGSASTTFVVSATNDSLGDGDKDVTIEVTSNGQVSAAATFKVIDDDIMVAKPDQQLTLRNQSVDVAVVANDLFPNSQLANLIVEVTSPPNPIQGTATVVNQLISVVPATDFVGVISLAYRIRDPLIGASEPTQVRVGVVKFGKHNAVEPFDVDANGFVSPSDALLIIDLLNDSSATRNVGEMPSPLAGPFVDTNGNGSVTPNDALLIINTLNSRPSGEGEGESLSPTRMVDMASFDIEQTWESTWQRRAGASRSRQGFRSW
jgi:hypothetical protein